MSKKTSNRSLFLVLGGVFLVATVAGLRGFRLLERSQGLVDQVLADAAAKGKGLDVEGCVDFAMAWYGGCEAMKSLCDASVGRVVAKCLGAQDRTVACAGLGDRTKDTHFGFHECKARGVDRWNKKACAESYRTIDRHCSNPRPEHASR